MTSPTTIKNRVSILVNGVTRLANEVFGSDLPVHAHHQHTELDHDDHLQYMTCAAGASRPFTGVVYIKSGLALRGEVEISFDDHYRTHSAYPAPGIPLSLAPTEWTAFLNTYGEASILGALVHAHNPYTPGTGISITNNVIANTGVTSLCKNGQTPLGGAWSFVEGANITITQNNGNHTLTIAGQAGGGAYDDSNCFYHSGSRPGTGNWTLFDGENYHGISGLTYLLGQADNQTDLFQGVLFGTTGAIDVRSKDHSTTPTKDARIFATLNEDITGSAVVHISTFDVDKRNAFGLDASGFYWHDYLARESSNWGSANPFLLADMFGEVNPYDRLYAALGDQRMDLVNILALLAEGGGSVLLEEGAVGFGDADGLLSGNATNLAWDESVFRLKVGPGPAPQHLGEASGIMLTGHMECTGNEYLYGHLVLGANGVESKIQSLTGSVQFEDAYCDWTTKPRLSNSLAQYTAVKSDFGGVEDSIFGYLHRLFNAVPGTATLQTAYDAGDTITIGSNGPVEILSDTATSGRGKCLFLRGTHADRIEPVVDIKNDSTSAGPSIYFQGNAGAANDYGHDLVTDETLSLHSSFVGYDTSWFDAFCKVSQEDGEGSLIARAVLKVDNESMGSPSAYLRLEAEYGQFTDLSSAYLAAKDIIIQAQSGGDVYLNTNGGGNITVSPGTGYTDLDSKSVQYARSVSYGSAPTSITYGTTIAANFLTGSAFQECIATGNITTVTLTAPAGVQTCQLKVTASGGARTITGFSGSVSWGEPIDPDVSAYTIPSGEWVIFWLYWNGSAWNGSALRQFS